MDSSSVNQAYTVMLVFLDDFCQRGGGPVQILLHWMMFLEDGRTYDPAIWEDWMKAVQEVQSAAQDPEAWEQLWKRLDSRHLDFI